jgi:hypothetical protein
MKTRQAGKDSRMFGYVVANMDTLSQDARERYRAVYCGLCRALGYQHGQPGRLALTYDMAFLILLLSALNRTELAEQKPIRCALHPLQQRTAFTNSYTRYAADMNVMLAYYQRLDDWQDERKASALLHSRVLGRSMEQVAARYPKQKQAIEEGLIALSRMEREGETNPDLPAAAFGAILGSVFAPETHEHADQLRIFGELLGRFIYVMDAAVDLKKDIQKERYNPLVAIPSQRHEQILNLLMADCTRAYEALPLLQDRELMDNILYSGVWTRYHQTKKEGESA